MSTATAKDIAKKLGISAASVSVALNGKPGVSQETRKKVLVAAAEMGYNTPKAAAPENKLICFLIYVDQIVGIAQQTTFYTFVLKGIEAAAKDLGYRVLIRYYYADQPFDDQVSDIINDISGMLILGTDMTAARRAEIGPFIGEGDLPFPIVIIDNFTFSAYVDCVGNDNLYGTKSAISYLIERGHRRIGYLRARQRITNFDDRENGIKMALREHAAQCPPLTIIDVDISAEAAFQDVCAWVQSAETLPDALFTENDVIAAAAIRALKSNHIDVPGQISVMGFDDIPICEMIDPPVTTVHSFKEKLGSTAVSMMHARRLAGENVQTIQKSGVVKVAMSTRIVERSSVADIKV